jgi:hypothetical protein
MKKKEINYSETFVFPGIDVVYPVYAISESGKIINFKSVSYPNPRSIKKFTRQKQLRYRSLQAKIFDAIINIGYFNPLTVWVEFPVVIQNSLRLPGQTGTYYYLDYYFPEVRVAVELDSDFHDPLKDAIRDQYLRNIGIETFRMTGLDKTSIQKKEFPKLSKLLRDRGILGRLNFDFSHDIRLFSEKKSPESLNIRMKANKPSIRYV